MGGIRVIQAGEPFRVERDDSLALVYNTRETPESREAAASLIAALVAEGQGPCLVLIDTSMALVKVIDRSHFEGWLPAR